VLSAGAGLAAVSPDGVIVTPAPGARSGLMAS
jgi:hypothetical protein